MNVIDSIRTWIALKFLPKARQEFDISPVNSPLTENFIEKCIHVYKGRPYWVNDDIKTINFAKSVCSEVARLTTLAIHIEVQGKNGENSPRAEWIEKQIERVFFDLRHWVEYGCGYGTIILKPSLDKIEVMPPNRFIITNIKQGDVRGVVFHDQVAMPDGKTFYNRLEYHRFLDDGKYAIDNRTYKGDSKDDTGKPVPIESTPWAGLQESVTIENIDKPLFGVFRTPQANNLELDAPLSLPIFADALQELKDLDIAYSRNATEIDDSQKIVLLDSDRMLITGAGESVKGQQSIDGMKRNRDRLGLPHYVKNVTGDGATTFYQEIVPQLNTAVRIQGINALLSQIGYKCGFSNGYFVFDEKQGLATATQIEADQQRTVQFVKDMRDKLEDCMDGLIYALGVFADLYDLAPAGEVDVNYDFGDITYNYAEDKAMWWNYAVTGVIPKWKYFEKFEGMTEEDAKALIEEAEQAKMAQEMGGLFGGEEGNSQGNNAPKQVTVNPDKKEEKQKEKNADKRASA